MRRLQVIGLTGLFVVVGSIATMSAPAAAAPAHLPQMVEFFSPSCSHCQRMMPIVDRLRQQLQGTVEIVAIDINKDGKAANKYNVAAIPTFVFLNAAGKEIFRHVGEYPEGELQAKLQELGWR